MWRALAAGVIVVWSCLFLFEPTVRFGLRKCSRHGACVESTFGAAPAYSSTGDVGFAGTLVLSANMDFSLQQVGR